MFHPDTIVSHLRCRFCWHISCLARSCVPLLRSFNMIWTNWNGCTHPWIRLWNCLLDTTIGGMCTKGWKGQKVQCKGFRIWRWYVLFCSRSPRSETNHPVIENRLSWSPEWDTECQLCSWLDWAGRTWGGRWLMEAGDVNGYTRVVVDLHTFKTVDLRG